MPSIARVSLKAALISSWQWLSPRRRRLAEFRARWGQPGDNLGVFADRYFELTRDEADDACVDDKSFADLELNRVFADMDNTVSPIGGQVLYAQLRTCVDDAAEASARHACSKALRRDASARERLQWMLASLREERFAKVADIVFGTLAEPMRFGFLLPIWSLLSIAVLAASILLSWSPWIWLGMVMINVVIVARVATHMMRDADAMAMCSRMLAVAARLARLQRKMPCVPQLAALAARAPQRAKAQRALRGMAILKGPVVEYAAIWLTLAFLAEPVLYVLTMKRFQRVRQELAETFRLVGAIDASVAVASYLEYRPDHCCAKVIDGPQLDIRDGGHPLITEPVVNSLRLDDRSALIVGSNMAGKTTFIKMVGLNVILGRTLGFCLASQAVIPRSKVMASIRSEHTVASGKSHYLAEVERIRSFVDAAARGAHALFLIDELFSGTNTVERVAAARAVLEAIGTRAQVLVTTHDVELQAPLSASYDLYHFREAPDVEGFFDYHLRPGAVVERNAIRVLQRLGFPDEVVARAMAYADHELVEQA